MSKWLLRLNLIGLLLVFSTGCSGEAPTAAVHGKITLAGQPVGPGTVVLQPDLPPGDYSLPNTSMQFGADGVFSGNAPVGKHKVMILAPHDEELEAKGQLPKSQIPGIYSDPAANNLTTEVKAGDNTLDFDMKAR
jgi:hypothetical protein